MRTIIIIILLFSNLILVSQEDSSSLNDEFNVYWSEDPCNTFINPTKFEREANIDLRINEYSYFSDKELSNFSVKDLISYVEKKYKMFDYCIIYDHNNYLRVALFDFFVSDTSYFQLVLCLPENKKFYIEKWYDKCREDLNFRVRMIKKLYKEILNERDYTIHQFDHRINLNIISFLDKANERKFHKLLKDYQKSKKKKK